MSTKKNLIATPILLNVLKLTDSEVCSDGMRLTYDTEKIYLNITINESDKLECEMYIAEKQIDLTDKQLDLVYTYVSDKLTNHNREEADFRRDFDVMDMYPQP